MSVKKIKRARRPRKRELERVARKYAKLHVKKGDNVRILAGKDRGKEGRVLQVLKAKGRCLVEGINQCKRHQKPNQQMQKGGIIEKEASVHLSNVQVIDTNGRDVTRIKRTRSAEGKSVRVAVKSGEQLDKS